MFRQVYFDKTSGKGLGILTDSQIIIQVPASLAEWKDKRIADLNKHISHNMPEYKLQSTEWIKNKHRMLVCGSREFATDQHKAWVLPILDRYAKKFDITCVIQGTCRGPDQFGAEWAATNKIECLAYPAQWNTYGKRAGYLRNQQMLDEGHPTLVVAFKYAQSRGTAMMIKLAEQAGVRVDEWNEKDDKTGFYLKRSTARK